MNKISVTKRGRPRKYKSNAERQRAYRKRRAAAKAERLGQITERRVFINPNKVLNNIVLLASPIFKNMDMGSWFRDRINWRPGVEIDRARIPEWIASLCEIRRDLNRFLRALKRRL